MLKQKLFSVCLGAAVLALAAGAVRAQAPALAETGLYAGLPEPTRQYVLAARKADAIPDRLQRCLAFPDMPGNQWDKNVARAQCELLRGRAITLDTVIEKLDKGAIAELDQLLRRDLGRHFSSTDFSEVIHYDFGGFRGADPRAEEVSKRWVALAPDSPFAHFARGRYLAHLARKARGGKFISETPRAQVVEMDTLAAQAIESLGKSLRLEPKMLPAYEYLLDLALITGNEALEKETVQRAAALDPACFIMASLRMYGMQPKWGGNFLKMAAYAKELRALAAARPLISLVIADGLSKLAQAAVDKEQWAEVIAMRLPVSKMAPNAAVFFDLGMNYGELAPVANPDALAALLTAYRFNPDDFYTVLNVGVQLFQFRDYGWAQPVLQAALKAEGGQGGSEPGIPLQFMLGVSLSYLSRHAESIPHLNKALHAPPYRQNALLHLTRALMFAGPVEQAKKLSAEHLREYPNDADAWFAAIVLNERLRDRAAQRLAMQGYLRVVNRNNKGTAPLIEQVEKDLARDEPAAPKP